MTSNTTREALAQVESLLTNLQPHIEQACQPGHAVFIDNYVNPALEILRVALASDAGVVQQTERHAFDAWRRDCFGPLTTNAEISSMWVAWQARAAQPATLAAPDTVERTLQAFEDRERGQPQAEIAARLAAELRAAFAAEAPQLEQVPTTGEEILERVRRLGVEGQQIALVAAPQPDRVPMTVEPLSDAEAGAACADARAAAAKGWAPANIEFAQAGARAAAKKWGLQLAGIGGATLGSEPA